MRKYNFSFFLSRRQRILFLIFLLGPICSMHAIQKTVPFKTVVIDAGHGGRDPGTVVGAAKEKNIVLDIALKLGNKIKENQKNIKIVYTRDRDFYVPLMDRAQIANKLKADLFISIHANYCSNPQVNGTETYVLGLHRTEDNLNVAKKENSVILLEEDYSKRYEGFNPNLSESYIMFELIQDTYLDQSLKFASMVQSDFKSLAQRQDREVRQAGFLVLRETSMPSVLIETGYLSNKKENSFLLTENGRSEIANSIYGSLVNYLTKLDTKESEPVALPSVKNNLKKDPVTNSSKRTKPKSEFESDPLPVIKKLPDNNIPDNQSEKKLSDEQGKLQSNNVSEGQKTTYAIQIGVFAKKVDLNSRLFKGLSPIRELKVYGNFKYFCYESDSLQPVKDRINEVLTKFPDAFVVSIKGDQTKLIWKKGSK